MKNSKATKGTASARTGQPASDATEPTPKQVYRAARAYIRAGLSLIPIRANGLKEPAIELLPKVWCEETGRYRRPWGGYRQRQPNREELREWFRDSGGSYGMAILAGKISGSLEILDLDNWDIVKPWTKLVERKAPGLLNKLVRVKTPRPGMHVYYRCDQIGGNLKLARVPVTDPETNLPKPKVLIEIKGEGGYCLAPPSPAACHPTGRCYGFVGKLDLTEVPTITAKERQTLHDCARSFNCWSAPRRQGYVRRPPGIAGSLGRPGDDYNLRADWADILEPHGWTWNGPGGDGSDRWTRPGKAGGTSASTNFAGTELLFVFSSQADPFEEGSGYTKFVAFALLNHGGDFRAAAQALREQGYGRTKSRAAQNPFERYAGYAKGSRS